MDTISEIYHYAAGTVLYGALGASFGAFGLFLALFGSFVYWAAVDGQPVHNPRVRV